MRKGHGIMAILQHLQTFFLLGIVVPAGVSSNVTITLTPGTLTLTPDQADTAGGHVNVTCQTTQTNGNESFLWQISIVRKRPDKKPSSSTIVRASMREKNGAAELRAHIPGAVVAGELGEGVISLSLRQASCRDEGRYTCMAEYSSASAAKTSRQRSQDLSVQVDPGPLTLTRSPRDKTHWDMNDVLTMSCQGPMGTIQPQQKVEWVWEFRNMEDAAWQPYVGRPSDVKSGPMVPHNCYMRGSSTLSRRLSLEDSDRQYRCYVRRGGVSFIQFAAVCPVGTVRALEPEPHLHSTVFLGLGVGGCVGMVVGLVVVAAAGVAFGLWRRRRRLSLMAQPANCPLLPKHRDPGLYGEYLEPAAHAPKVERQASIYSEIPNYEVVDISGNESSHSASTSHSADE